jgi:D-serine deaminase-like pyridoxal phosphate-dependent protein
MVEQAQAVSEVAQVAGRKAPVVLKIETGGDRYGVPPGKPALELAKAVLELPGIELAGIYTHEVYAGPTLEGAEDLTSQVASLMSETAIMIREAGFPIDHVSIGSSPTYRPACKLIGQGKFPEITELHPGSCIIGSVLHIRRFANTEENCALTVLAGVMSTSHEGHAVIDAGSKTFGSDALYAFHDRPDFLWEGKPSYGRVLGRPDLWVGAPAAESTRIFYRDPDKKLTLGQRLEIIPNNPFIVTNMHDQVYGVRKGRVEKVIPMTGRGRGS